MTGKRKVDPFDEDPFDTPFPGRPDHPDMKLVSRAAINADALVDVHHMDHEQAVATIVNPQVLHYLARNRAVALMARLPFPKQVRDALLTAVQAAYIDAFSIGYLYAKEKEKQS